jgi:hypothetical protein
MSNKQLFEVLDYIEQYVHQLSGKDRAAWWQDVRGRTSRKFKDVKKGLTLGGLLQMELGKDVYYNDMVIIRVPGGWLFKPRCELLSTFVPEPGQTESIVIKLDDLSTELKNIADAVWAAGGKKG